MKDLEEFLSYVLKGRTPFRLFLFALFLTLCLPGSAAVDMSQRTVTMRSRFAINGTRINTHRFSVDNSGIIRSFWAGGRIDSIVVTGSASPDGSTLWNEKMAVRRMSSLANWIESKLSVGGSRIVRRTNISDWHRLLVLIENSYDMPNQGGAEYVLRELIAEKQQEGKLTDIQITRRLKQIAGRSAWQYITTRLLPRMRTAEATIYYHNNDADFHYKDVGPDYKDADSDNDNVAKNINAGHKKVQPLAGVPQRSMAESGVANVGIKSSPVFQDYALSVVPLSKDVGILAYGDSRDKACA